MGDGPVYWDDDARRRIRRGIYRIEAGDTHGRGPGADQGNFGHTWHLAYATETALAGSVVDFQIIEADGNKGAEVDSSVDPIPVYIRKGLVFEGTVYLIVEICGGGDAIFEVADPDLEAVSFSTAPIAKGGDADLDVWHGVNGNPETNSGVTISDVQCNYGAVGNSKRLRIRWMDGGAWEIVNAEC